MKTIALLGPIGMLGSAVYGVLQTKYKLVLVLRDIDRLRILEKAYGGVKNHRHVFFDSDQLMKEYADGFPTLVAAPTWTHLVSEIGDVDGVVNCIGITNRFSQQQPLIAYFINSAFPNLRQQYLQFYICGNAGQGRDRGRCHCAGYKRSGPDDGQCGNKRQDLRK